MDAMDYDELVAQIEALTEGVQSPISNLANAAALLFNSMKNVSWAGFYILEGETLVLGPFMGKPACVLIPMGKGVCGTAAAEEKTVTVPDVRLFPGHIACDTESRSEIVVPVQVNGTLYGVMDIDSAVTDRFSDDDRKGLERFAAVLGKALENGKCSS